MTTTPTADKLRPFYPGKNIGSHNAALPTYTADAACTAALIKDAALVEADGYWDGAIGWCTGNTTAAIKGAWFHVRSFTTAGGLVLSRNLPAAPAAGDTYRLILGGGFASAQEVMGMMGGGVQPELDDVVGTNITGLTVNKLGANLGECTLTAFFDQSESLLFLKRDSEEYGVGVTTAGNPTNAIAYIADGQGWMQFTIVTASLPVGDETDTVTVTYPYGTMTPDYEGDETAWQRPSRFRQARLRQWRRASPSASRQRLSMSTPPRLGRRVGFGS